MKEIFKKSLPNGGVLVDLYTSTKYVDMVYVPIGEYYMIYVSSEVDEDSYVEANEGSTLASFRIWLEHRGLVDKEEMITLLTSKSYALAGLVFLSWMREEWDERVDPYISSVEISAEDWSTILNVLTCNEYVRN